MPGRRGEEKGISFGHGEKIPPVVGLVLIE